MHELDEKLETVDADERRSRQVLKAALDGRAHEAQPGDRLEYLGRRCVTPAPHGQQVVFQQIDQMQAEPERGPWCERLNKGSIATVGGERRGGEDARNVGAVRPTVQLTPASLHASDRAGQQPAGDPGDRRDHGAGIRNAPGGGGW